MKHDHANSASGSGAAVKQEEPLPYMLGPSIDQQQLDPQVLQDAGANIITGTAGSDIQTDNPQFQPQLSNPIVQGQSQVFGDKNQQCEKRTKSSCLMTISADRRSRWLQRLESC